MQASYAIVLANQAQNMQVLVMKRKNGPKDGAWELPGGMMKEGSMPLDFCVENLKLETGLDFNKNMAVKLKKREKKGRDSRGNVVAFPFVFHLDDVRDLGPGKDIKELRWISLYVLKELELDFGAMLCESLGKFWKRMPSYNIKFSDVELPSLFIKKELHYRDDIMIFFGGSFYPWHEGHLECLNLCPLDTITIVPDYNPWKETDLRESSCYWKQYQKLCMKLKDTPYAIYSGFWGVEDPNPTVNWIPNIKAEKKGLLLGDDSFHNILDWKDSDRLITFLNVIYVVPRVHKVIEIEEMTNKVLSLHPNMMIEILPEHKYMSESSTIIRQKTKKGQLRSV